MRVLVACEYSGVVRRAFREAGHEAFSCDLLESEDNSEYHYTQDVVPLLTDGWDLMIAHPPCTYLSSSGLHWNARGRMVDGRPRAALTEEAIEFVRVLLDAPIPHIALENPVGCISTHIRRPEQIIQPYEYGHDASKRTCLWLKNLPLLQETKYVLPRMVEGFLRWGNQTDSGQNKLPPSKDRWKKRSVTYSGIANAMAAQWGPHIEEL